MRFSSALQSAREAKPQAHDRPREAARPQRERETPAARPASWAALPEDLDARVRLIGEWQLGES